MAVGLGVAVAVGVSHYAVDRAFLVVGPSMSPTLSHNDLVWIDRCGPAAPCAVQRGDLIVAHVNTPETQELVIKRVVGLPGDFIRMTRGRLIVNEDTILRRNAMVIESPPLWVTRHRGATLTPRDTPDEESIGALELAHAEYFIVGDNPAASRDSRHFGPIVKQDILAASSKCLRAHAVLWRLRLLTLCRAHARG